jgi:hypothetical protein
LVRALQAALLSVALLVHLSPALAGDVEDCQDRYLLSDMAAACLRLAEKGESWAQFRLAYSYQWGYAGEKDLEKAARWYRRAANQGLWQAQWSLAVMYSNGRGVRRDRIQGLKWLTIAAFSTTGREHDLNIKLRDGFAKMMTAEEIAVAERLALEWTPIVERP